MGVMEIESTAAFQNTVLSGKKVVVDFWASWCGPCMMMKPVLNELAEAYPQIVVASVNVDEVSQPAMQFGIDSIPAFILFENGKPVKKTVGAKPLAQLAKELGL